MWASSFSHLNRTIAYGVTPGCGTQIEYGGRGHTFILGTASIDNKGRGVHHGIFESSSTIRKISTCETIYVIIQ